MTLHNSGDPRRQRDAEDDGLTASAAAANAPDHNPLPQRIRGGRQGPADVRNNACTINVQRMREALGKMGSPNCATQMLMTSQIIKQNPAVNHDGLSEAVDVTGPFLLRQKTTS